jgi:putative nucleotidyltransferase with HDIG domain
MTTVDEHCRRVAGLCGEISRQLGLSEPARKHLESAALSHHANAHAGKATARLAAWLNQSSESLSDPPISNESVRALRIFHGGEAGCDDPEAQKMGEVLRLANSFDEMLEFRRFDPRPVASLLPELDGLERYLGGTSRAAEALAVVCRDRSKEILAAAGRLPVSAISVLRQLVCVPASRATVSDLKAVGQSDPALTAALLQAVNSAAQSPPQKISSVGQAIQYLGTETAHEVLVSQATRMLFASSAVHSLWQHSLSVAADTRWLAKQEGLDGNEAFLAGLLHDIGRLTITCLGGEGAQTYARLREWTVPAVWAEWVAFQSDHAEIGALLMEKWGASQTVVDAIRFHHQPENCRSRLAAMLYLMETRNDDGENDEEPERLLFVLDQCGLTPDDFAKPTHSYRRRLLIAG